MSHKGCRLRGESKTSSHKSDPIILNELNHKGKKLEEKESLWRKILMADLIASLRYEC